MKVLAEEGTNQMIEEIKKLKNTSSTAANQIGIYDGMMSALNAMEVEKIETSEGIERHLKYRGSYMFATLIVEQIAQTLVNSTLMHDDTDSNFIYDGQFDGAAGKVIKNRIVELTKKIDNYPYINSDELIELKEKIEEFFIKCGLLVNETSAGLEPGFFESFNDVFTGDPQLNFLFITKCCLPVQSQQ